MTRIRIDMAISVDGFVAGPNQGPDAPLGEGGRDLHLWQFATDMMGPASSGEPVPDDATPDQRILFEHFAGVGAYVMGRNMFGGGPGPWPSEPAWDGWWGPNPPYHTPVFVLTHHAREPLELEGGNVFHFVTDGPEAALTLAREAAGDQDIRIAGGGSTAAAYLAMGVVDELQFHVSPVLLGSGERPFPGAHLADVGLEIDRVVASPLTTHIRYRVR
jgi:dihydrofolate reductase